MSRYEPLLEAVATALDEVGACGVTAQPVQTVVVAVSGGPDSVCLFHAMDALLFGRSGRPPRCTGQLHVAHLHHGLRGAEADQDAAFVNELAERADCPVTIGRADIRHDARAWHVSTQVAARERRYRFLREVAGQNGADWIAVAHTANDQAETLLFRLLRGTGPAGLAGMRPLREGRIIRPLLRVTRDGVLDYLKRHQVAFREDQSNLDRHYTRNRLRLELLPQLARDYNPNIITTLARTATVMDEEQQLVEALLQSFWEESLIEMAPDRLVFHRSVIVRQPMAVRRWWLRRALYLVGEEATAGERGRGDAEGGPVQEIKAGSGVVNEVLRRIGRAHDDLVDVRGGFIVRSSGETVLVARSVASGPQSPLARPAGAQRHRGTVTHGG